MGRYAVFVGQHAAGRSADRGAGSDFAGSRFFGRDQSALRRPLDRLNPPDNLGWVGSRVRIPENRPGVLRGRDRSDRLQNTAASGYVAEAANRYLNSNRMADATPTVTWVIRE